MFPAVGSERALEDFASTGESFTLIEDPVKGQWYLENKGFEPMLFERIFYLTGFAEVWIQLDLSQPFVCFRDVLGSTLELL